jgi:hypothetical protein
MEVGTTIKLQGKGEIFDPTFYETMATHYLGPIKDTIPFAEGGRVGLQGGSRQPGIEHAVNRAAREKITRDVQNLQQTMAERGGGDAQAYVRAYQGDRGDRGDRGDERMGPFPEEIRGGPTPTGYGDAIDLTKAKAHKKILESMNEEDEQTKIINTAEAAMKSSNVNPQVYNDVLGKLINNVKFGIITTEMDGINFLKNELGGEKIPGGPIIGGTVTGEIGPLNLGVNIGDKTKYSAALNFDDLTGKIAYGDRDLTGKFDYEKNLGEGIVKAGIDFNNPASILDVGYNLGYEGDKVGIGASGTGTSGQISARLDPFTGTVSYPDKNWTLGVDQSLFQNPDPNEDLSLVGEYGSDDQWNLGFKWSKGIDQRPYKGLGLYQREEQSEIEKYLSQFETPTSYEQDIFADKGSPEYFPDVRSRVNWDPYNLYAKGGAAGIGSMFRNKSPRVGYQPGGIILKKGARWFIKSIRKNLDDLLANHPRYEKIPNEEKETLGLQFQALIHSLEAGDEVPKEALEAIYKNPQYYKTPRVQRGYGDPDMVEVEELIKEKLLPDVSEELVNFETVGRKPNVSGGRVGYVPGGPVFKGAFKKFFDQVAIKISNEMRRGLGIWKDLTQEQRITQHDNFTKVVDNIIKTGKFDKKINEYAGFDLELAYFDAQGKAGRMGKTGPGWKKAEIEGQQQDEIMNKAFDDVAHQMRGEDLKYEADVLADSLANQQGKVYDDLVDAERSDLYGQAYNRLSSNLKAKMDLEKSLEAVDQKTILSDFDVTGRKQNAFGGGVGSMFRRV